MVEERNFKEINPDIWKPNNEEDFIEGKYVSRKEGVGQYNSNCYYLEKEGVKMMVWGSTVIDDRMSLVNVGDYVRITYKGTKPSKKGKPLQIYKVEVSNGENLPDNLATTEEREATKSLLSSPIELTDKEKQVIKELEPFKGKPEFTPEAIRQSFLTRIPDLQEDRLKELIKACNV